MKQLNKFMCFLLWINLILPVHAAPPLATVEVTHQAAALQRDGAQKPLAMGVALVKGDVITTGAQARVQIRFADGTVVKIGEHAKVAFDRLIPSDKGFIAATLNIVSGLLRFTANTEVERDVQLEVGEGINIGIRGTDLFAKASEEKDVVCLIQGKISVQSGSTQELLTQPRQFFIVPRGKPPLAVDFIGDEMFNKWVKGTELE